MTLIATLHPHYYPIVLSDLLVTSGQYEITARTNQQGVVINVSKDLFCRKVITFDEGPSAYGFAGEAAAIIDFVEALRLRFPHRDRNIPPARFVGELVRAFNSDYGCNAISCVGMTAWTFEVGKGINVLRGIDRLTHQTRNFSEIYAAGSGASAFFKLVSNNDGQLDDDGYEIEQKIIQMIGQINATVLYSRGDEFAALGWGGYVEALVIPNYESLYREPEWHYMAFEIDETGSIERLSTQYHYYSTSQCQGLLVIEEDHDRIEYRLLPIQNVLDEHPMRSMELIEPPDWKVIPVTVTLFFKNRNRMATYTMMVDELDAVERLAAWCLNLSNDYCSDLARDMTEKLRLTLGL